MKRLIVLLLCLCMMLPLLAMLPFDALAAEAKFTLEKTIFVQGEPIMVTPEGSGKDWIGIAPKGKVNSGGVYWCYIAEGVGSGLQAGHGSGTPVDIRSVYAATGHEDYHGLPVGEYTVFWVPNNGSAGSATYTQDITVVMGTSKTTYAYGEPIMVTAWDTGTGADWIGIGRKEDVAANKGSVRWKYIAKDKMDSGRPASKGAGSGVAVDIRTGEIAGGNYALGDIGVGTWTVFWARKGTPNTQYTTYSIDITVTDGPMTLDKIEYYVGEPIMLSAKMAGADTNTWCGILPDVDGKPYGSYGTIIWYELANDPQNKNTATEGVTPVPVDLRAHTGAGFGTMGNATKQKDCAAMMGCTVKSMFNLPAGTYWVVYCADSTTLYNGSGVTHMIQITIKPVLTVNKTEFAYGEPIMVTPIGEGKDWVFIAPKHEDPSQNYASIRWAYIDPAMGSGSDKGKGSGVAFDIRQATLTTANFPELGLIPPGEYSLFIVFDPGSKANAADHGTRIDIVVSGEAPDAPDDVTYDLTDKTTGLADGTVTVVIYPEKFANTDSMPTHAILYWGDANGPLADYTEIGYRALTAATTTISMLPGSVIPSEATHLWVAAYNGAGVSETMFAVALPADRTYPALGEEQLSFQIVSDVHSKANVANLNRIENFFNDVKLIDPDSAGIFVSGDITDHGSVIEYENLFALWDKVLGSQSDVMIPFFPAVGNHEFKPDDTMSGYGDYATKQARFIEYLNRYLEAAGKDQITNGKHYYDLWIGEYHFIFLGSEVSGTNAYISDAQLKWLDETLAEDRKNGHPSFVMLHQCLYNTVSGGMPAHGWNGVVAGDDNWKAWEAAIGAGNAPTNRTMKDTYEAPLREILRKYPEAMMFSGHSHWAMSDINNMYNPGFPTDVENALPNYLFNTGAVDYLASALTGKDIAGSQGYYVYIYEDYIEFRGRDFANKKWMPNATYRIALDELCVHEHAAACAVRCPDCSAALTATALHTYSNACDADCNLCGATRTPDEHRYDNDCDTDCNVCGATRTVGDHQYDNDCDTDCNACGATRTVGDHRYENDCDATCDICGALRTVGDHQYDNDCDADCNVCGATRTVGDHQYDNACDTACNTCGHVREVGDHVREHLCDTVCTECGKTLTDVTPHEGLHSCSEICRHCGEKVVERADGVTHAPAFPCSDTCSTCGESVVPQEAHDNLYDCSDICRHCREDLGLSTTDHTRKASCSTTCSLCDETIASLGAHTRKAPCSTACLYCEEIAFTSTLSAHTWQYPCSETCAVCLERIAPKGDHELLSACSPLCKNCAQSVYLPTAGHTAAFPCSDRCKDCNALIPPALSHSAAHSCSDLCVHCNTEIPGLATGEHLRAFDCSTACQRCSAPLTQLVAHESEHPCSNICKYCEQGVVAVTAAHQGQYDCSALCTVCGEAMTPLAPHTQLASCSELCETCRTVQFIPSDSHTAAYECSDTCQRCRVAITPTSQHESAHPCSNICKHCHAATVAATAPHAGTHPCSTTCAACGIAITAEPHTYGTWQKYNDLQHKKACVCGEAIHEDHAWNEGEVTAAPTATQEGTKTFTCATCSATKTEPIEKLSSEQGGSSTDANSSGNGSDTETNGIGTGAIVAIALGGTALVAGGGFAAYWFLLRKRKITK